MLSPPDSILMKHIFAAVIPVSLLVYQLCTCSWLVWVLSNKQGLFCHKVTSHWDTQKSHVGYPKVPASSDFNKS